MTHDPESAGPIYLVDGTSQLFRAFFAIRGLSNGQGLPTGAVYGFLTMLRKLLQDESPERIAVAFDLPGPTFRHDRYAEYKANRPPLPDDIRVQLPYAKEVCLALRIPVLEMPGYEADDLIATWARLARERGYEVVVVASDKDLLQLVGDGISVLNPTKNLRLDAEGVLESFGVLPERVRDVLGLMGDSVDNIPGVPGVGEKTAQALVSAYGDVEAIVARAERFVLAFEARDALVEALHAAGASEPSGEDAVGRAEAAGTAFSSAVEALLSSETDEGFRLRLEAAKEAVHASGVLEGARRGSRELRPVEKTLKDLDKGSSRRVWQAVHENREQALLSRELATLDRNAPVVFDLEPLRRGPADRDRLLALYRTLAFRSLLAELEAEGPSPPVATEVESRPAAVYETVLTADALREIAARARERGEIAIAVQSSDAPSMTARLLGIALAIDEGRASYVPLDPLPPPDVREVLGTLLADSSIRKLGHDLKSAAHVLRRHGLPLAGWHLDTKVAAFLLEAERQSFRLDSIANQHLGQGTAKPAERPARGAARLPFEPVDVDRARDAAGEEAEIVYRLAHRLAGRLEEEGLLELYRTIDGPLLPVLERMEERGIRVDAGILAGMSHEMEGALQKARSGIYESVGHEFNVDSPKQLREVLFEKLGLTAKRRTAKSGELSTDAATLEVLASEHEVARRVLEYRELAKLKGTYVDSLPLLIHPETGRVHTSFHPTGAATGRISSSDPNLQNIPVRTELGRKIRSAFVPAPGTVFLASDYSQVELRVLAHLVGDEGLIAAFRAGEDIHRRTASGIFGVVPELVTDAMRRRAKAVNFGILYGMSESRLARDQGLTRMEARKFIAAYFERFAKVKEYIERTRAIATRDAKVTTLFGRVRRFPELRGGPGRAQVEAALRAAVNTPIQGTAADLMKLAMLRVEEAAAKAGLGARMLLQVHDELLFEVPEDQIDRAREVVREAMESVWPLAVPLVVDQKVGMSWMEVT